jgi:hypothetical protein
MRILGNRWQAGLVFAAGLAVGSVAVGAAMATIPDANGTIRGCYAPGSTPPGNLRVINQDAGQACRSTEKLLKWSQTGPAGAKGAAGPKGAQGIQGPQGQQGQQGPAGAAAPLPIALIANTGTHAQFTLGQPIDYHPWTLSIPPGSYLLSGVSNIEVLGQFPPDVDMSTLKCRIGWADDPAHPLAVSIVQDAGQAANGDRNLEAFVTYVPNNDFAPSLTVSGTAPRTLEGVCTGPAPSLLAKGTQAGYGQVTSSLTLTPATITRI